MTKNGGGTGDTAMPVEAGGMTEERWVQWVRLKALELADRTGQMTGKFSATIMQDAEAYTKWVLKGEKPKKD